MTEYVVRRGYAFQTGRGNDAEREILREGETFTDADYKPEWIAKQRHKLEVVAQKEPAAKDQETQKRRAVHAAVASPAAKG